MQNLIEHFYRIYDKCNEQEKPILASVLNFANISLEKEKQQIFHCFNNAADEINEKRFNEWFNQTYNQNK